ncbi:MAG: hypothetical protein QOJ57_2987 [Thermoleophilaceae bacterium]|nr:hypothetical protein [Thermoleophilaceae bacterium]
MTLPAPVPRDRGVVVDDRLPAVRALLGPEAAAALAPAVAADGGRIRSLRPRLVNYWPGDAIRISYDAHVEFSDHAEPLTLVAGATATGTREGEIEAHAAGMPIDVWRVPDDPRLPGLRHALDRVFVSELLDSLGISSASFEIRLMSYSPRSRAMVEVSYAPPNTLVFRPGEGVGRASPRPLLYLKVMRPERAAAVRNTHEVLGATVPIATCSVERDDIGLLGFQPMSGRTLWDELTAGAPVPGADDLLALLERFEGAEIGEAGRAPIRKTVRYNAETLAATVPDRAAVIDRFLEALGDAPEQPRVTIHGDFHEMQVLTAAGRIAALLDMDDAGTGERMDDFAMLLGRLWCFGQTEPDPDGRVAAYTESLLRGFSELVDARELRIRMAAVAMNHATGHFRFQHRGWPQLTREAIDRADRLLASTATLGGGPPALPDEAA